MRVHSTHAAARPAAVAAFVHGSGSTVSLAGISARQLNVDKKLVKLGADLEKVTVPAGPNATTSPLPIAVAAFRVEPGALATVLGDKKRTQDLIRAAFVSSVGGDPDPLDRQYETLEVRTSSAGKVIPALLKHDADWRWGL